MLKLTKAILFHAERIYAQESRPGIPTHFKKRFAEILLSIFNVLENVDNQLGRFNRKQPIPDIICQLGMGFFFALILCQDIRTCSMFGTDRTGYLATGSEAWS